MAERDTSREIDQAASEWAARLDRGPLSSEAAAAHQAWLDSDPRAKGAMLRAKALSMMSESARALGTDFDPAAFAQVRRPRLSRRQALTWTGAAAAAASLAALGVTTAAAGTVISTDRGEIRLVPLKDGSTVLLNTDSRIRVRYDRDQRIVTLLKGEAYFSAARDEARPFVVEVNGRRLRTAQAGFRVRKLDQAPVDLLVNLGRVEVSPAPLIGAARVVAVTANTRLALSDPAHLSTEQPCPITPEAVTRDLAWREGKLAFEGRPWARRPPPSPATATPASRSATPTWRASRSPACSPPTIRRGSAAPSPGCSTPTCNRTATPSYSAAPAPPGRPRNKKFLQHIAEAPGRRLSTGKRRTARCLGA
ncbi:FecR family protein [Caulobacter segnis]